MRFLCKQCRDHQCKLMSAPSVGVIIFWEHFTAAMNTLSLLATIPMLLRIVLDEMEPKLASNLKAGFKKAGIFPTNKEEILSRLPNQDKSVNLSLVGDAFLTHLEQKRREFVKPQTRKKKIQVAPGKSICASDIQPEEVDASTSRVKATESKRSLKSIAEKKAPPKKTIKKKTLHDSTSEDDSAYSICDSGESDFVLSEYPEDEIYTSPNEQFQIQSKPPPADPPSLNPAAEKEMEEGEGTLKGCIQEGNFVLVSWNNKLFPGVVMTIEENGAVIDCMEPTKKAWKWPEEKDTLFYKWCDIQKIITPPTLLKRGLFSIAL